jgi:hypothetical protein
MKKYEYEIITIKDDMAHVERLNELGKMGFRVKNTVIKRPTEHNYSLIVILEREIQ